jgi:signal transduction histidine kinase
MAWRRWREFLFPGAAERDEPFRQNVLRASHRGLPAVGIVEILAAVLMARTVAGAVAALLGLATLLLGRTRFSRRNARWIVLGSTACALAFAGWVRGDSAGAAAMLILLSAVVAVPLLPIQVLGLGAAAELFYRDVLLAALAVMATGIAATLYARRLAAYREHQESLRIAEALSGAQLRAQLAESAVAIGKLAAAVTHEINTPLGALTSAVDTLLVVAARQATASEAQQERLVKLQADLRKNVQAATDRIRHVIGRLQRFISLEEAELQSANVNELIGDVATLFKEQVDRGIQLQFDFQPVPTVMCRPQLITAVISSLLSNAFNAANGDGRIVVSTRVAGSAVEIAVRDNGRGMSAEQVENIFDPGFKVVSGNRISSGNWSLFNSRQIIFEHGGDIRIDSAEGKGTTVWVTLPV